MAGKIGKSAIYSTSAWRIARDSRAAYKAASDGLLRATAIEYGNEVSPFSADLASGGPSISLHSPVSEMALQSRAIFGTTPIAAAHRDGTHCSLACAEVEWLPSCFRFGVGYRLS